jgi:hypothetical protein
LESRSLCGKPYLIKIANLAGMAFRYYLKGGAARLLATPYLEGE